MTVGPRHRLTLPKRLSNAAGWLDFKGGPIQLLAGRGMRGGLRLYPPGHRDRLLAVIRDVAESAATADAVAVDLARWMGMTWEVSIDSEGRLILPEPPRKLGLVPSAREVGVVFAYGETLEIWRLEAWDRYFAEHGYELAQMTEDTEPEPST